MSDNGRPFLTRFSCLTESYIQEEYNIAIEAIPLCEYHAWSLCDSHGGVVKSKLKQAEIAEGYPVTISQIREFLEEHIRGTIVLPQICIPVQHINETYYSKFRGFANVGPVEKITGVRRLKYPGVGRGRPEDQSTTWGDPPNVALA